MNSVWDGRLVVVTGPAGSGKTTLLAQYAGSLDSAVVWYSADAADSNPRRLLGHVQEGLSTSLGSLGSARQKWENVDDAVATFECLGGNHVLLVIDDIQALEGTPSETAVERLAWFAPPGLGIMVASRRQPGFNLSRLRVANRLVEVDADALRFRSWEVERLFHDIYEEPLPPEDLATLARRTQGWAAGLQLFHLASQGKPAIERRQMVRNLSSRSRLVREYLTHNVVDELPGEIRDFLLDTCVLGRLTGSMCDDLLDRTGSAAILEDIERRQIFLCPIDDGPTFRYHEVLRSHLEASLVELVGERQARERYARAAILLEANGAPSEALRAYCRAGDESAALRLLSHSGADVAEDPSAWLDLLPSGLADHDPWLMLATARHQLAAGHWRRALASYQRAEACGNGSSEQYRRERMTVITWLEPGLPLTADWVGVVRQSTRKDPLAARHLAMTLPVPHGRLAAGLAALLAGQLTDAHRLLKEAAEDVDASPATSAGAWLAAGVAGLFMGAERASKELHEGREQAEDLGLTWLARLASCAEVCLSSPSGQVSATYPDPEDTWGRALFGLLRGLGGQAQPDAARPILVEAAELFRDLGAAVLEAWARAGAAGAAARAGHHDAGELIAGAEVAARATSAWGALAATHHASAMVYPERARDLVALADQLDAECIIQLSVQFPAPGRSAALSTLTCFGDFRFVVNGRELDLAAVKPRVRSLVRLLALHSGRPVHRESLIEALWPGATPQTGARSLHVAISSARQLVGNDEAIGAVIVRDGDSYCLIHPEGTDVDVRVFDEQFDRARWAKARGDHKTMLCALAACLDLYRGEVLSAEGPADWVVEVRERYRLQAADASQALAEAHLGASEYQEAARVCELGLSIDRYRDQLWRLRAEALEGAGDLAAAARARLNYGAILRELGVGTA